MTAVPAAPHPGKHPAHWVAIIRPKLSGDAATWERPALAAVLALAAGLYTWGIRHAALHPFYGAAIRSMAGSWRAFFFGGLDTSGSISIDKLPGAFWPDALSVWLFGPHTWAAALPQDVEGVLTVWLLHRIVRAWAGPIAALIAALALTLTPITVVLNRATIPDTALTLLLVAAAGSLQKAMRSKRLLPMITCGIWVGLAFQAKMLQAWLILPVFAAVHEVVAPGTPLNRALRFLLGSAVALAISCLWMLIALVTPVPDRPYLDGTSNNDPFALVFGYNGLSRFTSDSTALGAVAGSSTSRTTGNTGWNMLINHTVGPQVAWLLPLAVLATLLGILWRTGQPRTDPLRAGFLLWGGWLGVHALVFSSSNGNHAYYTAVLAPALAALSGGGLELFRAEYEAAHNTKCVAERQDAYRRRGVLPAAITLTVAWALVLDWPTRFLPQLPPIAVMLALLAVVGLWSRGPRTLPRLLRAAFAAGVAAILVLPAGWALSSLDPLYAGAATAPIAGPVGNAYYYSVRQQHAPQRIGLDQPSARDAALLDYLIKHRHRERYLVATQAAYSAEPLLRAKSEPVLVMGGFTGNTPFPNSQQVSSLVTDHQLRYALLTTQRPTTLATIWVKSHCTRVRPTEFGSHDAGNFTLYDCSPEE
ncbi:ArnT family glycosyltransferase [Streptomyces sp. NPDC094468]|uniref:ArnT family glycosyltransferase n=1 Tax=Streptomyces sp. NPDC094468 TaxID=3366066 RepID=UPI00381F7C9D